MEHMAWKGRIKPGCKAEYQKRHAEIWPEMVQVLKDAGICNYSIFYCNDELFGYYECEKGVAYAEKVQAESPVVARWNEYIYRHSRKINMILIIHALNNRIASFTAAYVSSIRHSIYRKQKTH